MDFTGSDGGQLAIAFGAGCAAAYGFIQTAIVGPLKRNLEDLKADCERRDERASARIATLEGALFAIAPGDIRQQMQKALSEQHIEITELTRKL